MSGHFGRRLHYVASNNTRLGGAQDKSSIAWILRVFTSPNSPLLDQTSAGNDEGAGADFRTGGEVKREGMEGNDGGWGWQIRETR